MYCILCNFDFNFDLTTELASKSQQSVKMEGGVTDGCGGGRGRQKWSLSKNDVIHGLQPYHIYCSLHNELVKRIIS